MTTMYCGEPKVHMSLYPIGCFATEHCLLITQYTQSVSFESLYKNRDFCVLPYSTMLNGVIERHNHPY
uniref:Uncharacterized protein n=1 Tax=Anguilla anguilla TaxID=7936 RepID=A0A0E9SLD5_ANGAN